jgi:DNA polymerase
LGEIVAQIKAHLRYQKGLGIRTLLSRQEARPLLTLEAIRSEMGECTRCRLHEERQSVVFGEGNPQARLVFVGEAPGREEDLQGRPFVGRAGELLTRIIEAIDLTREEVYIANIVKCRPPGNRNPQPDEIRTCLPFLRRQLETIRPRIICALGTFAAQTLLETEERISILRGRFYAYQGARLMPTYHPAFLLRNPQFKRDVWEDMKAIREEYNKG